MRVRLLLYVALFVLLGGCLVLHGVHAPGARVTCKQLNAERGRWNGRRVLLSTAGCERDPDNARRLVWRQFYGRPPVVIIDLRDPLLGDVPPKVDGVVRDLPDSPLLVEGGRPVW